MINKTHSTLLMESWAWYSDDERYRYLLRRIWSTGPAPGPAWLFIGTNPSKATELANDPTFERMERRARNAGAGSITFCNVHALRSTDPDALLAEADPTGPENDATIKTACAASDLVICGWGNHRAVRERGRQVLQLVRDAGKVPHALKINRDGSPAHPLYLPYSAVPVEIA